MKPGWSSFQDIREYNLILCQLIWNIHSDFNIIFIKVKLILKL